MRYINKGTKMIRVWIHKNLRRFSMNVIEALNTRRSIRGFKSDPISKNILNEILAAANRSPSWTDSQPWEIFVASGETLEKLRKSYMGSFEKGIPSHPDIVGPRPWPPAIQKRVDNYMEKRFAFLGVNREDAAARRSVVSINYQFFGAPVVIFLCMDKTLSGWSMFDIGSLAQSIMLAAQDKGLDSVAAFTMAVYPDLIRTQLDIPEEYSILIGIALGYADNTLLINKFRSPRRPLEEVVRYKGI
jgi:nitroreductase